MQGISAETYEPVIDTWKQMQVLLSQEDPSKREAAILVGFDIFWDGLKTNPHNV